MIPGRRYVELAGTATIASSPRLTVDDVYTASLDSLVLVRIALVAVLSVVAVATVPDPDLWGHLRFGADTLARGLAPRVDIYSFTADRAWIDHEWLAEAVMALAYAKAGVAGLIALKAALVATILGIVVWSLTRYRPRPMVYDLVVAVVSVGMIWRIQTVRPQIFSLALFAVLLGFLSEADRGRRYLLMAVPLVMGLWANLHGGWLVGWAALVMWALAGIVERPADWRAHSATGAATVAALLATLVNPYGWRMWAFLLDTVRLSRADVAEWWPVSRIPLGASIPYLLSLVAAAAAVAAVRSGRPRRIRGFAVVAMLAAAAFRVNRLDGFLAIGVGVLLAPEIAAAWPRQARGTTPLRVRRPSLSMITITSAMAIAVAVPSARLLANQTGCLELDANTLPEPEATRFIEANALKGNVLTWFDWGEYALWHFGPALKVSVDGRRETTYSGELLAAHYAFYRGDRGSETLPDRLRADFVWVPANLPVVEALKQSGWTAAFQGPRSVLLQRPGTRPLLKQAAAVGTGRRCFPGA